MALGLPLMLFEGESCVIDFNAFEGKALNLYQCMRIGDLTAGVPLNLYQCMRIGDLTAGVHDSVPRQGGCLG